MTKPSSAMKSQVRRRPQHARAWQGRGQTGGRRWGCPADKGEQAHGGGRRSVRRGAQTDGSGRASACVRPRTAAEPMWHVRQTSRAAFAFPRDSVSVCPYLNEFYSKFCN
jgi:hypothetical protein